MLITNTFGHLTYGEGLLVFKLLDQTFLMEILNGQMYLEFLQNGFQDLVDDTAPLNLLNRLVFMEHGVPPHSTHYKGGFVKQNSTHFCQN